MQRLSNIQKEAYQQNGYLLINDFIPASMCAALMDRAKALIADFNVGAFKTIFSTKHHQFAKQKYFLESSERIHFFFEENAFDDNSNLVYPKETAINKIGHGLHLLDPVFKTLSDSPQLQQLLADLAIENPRTVQSMYIFKQPFIGGEVKPHQDSTFLYVHGQPVTGFWFALEDATIENGCLWAIPGGHLLGLKLRMFRREGADLTVETYDDQPWPIEKMVPLEIKRGGVILLHGHLPHMSKENHSNISRQAYSLHIMSSDDRWSAQNWMRLTQ